LVVDPLDDPYRRTLAGPCEVLRQRIHLVVKEVVREAGPTHFGLIRRSAVEGWARISSGRIRNELTDVSRGQYDFGQLEPLLMPQVSEDADQESE
jgi:hypothetical protein